MLSKKILIVFLFLFFQNIGKSQSILQQYTSSHFKEIHSKFSPYEDSIHYYFQQSSQPLLPNDRTEVLNNYNRQLSIYRTDLLAFVNQNSSDSIVPQWLIYSYFNIDKSEEWNEKYLQILNTNAPHNSSFQYFKEELESLENVQVGKPAPDFTLPDQNDKFISLHDYLGKYVLINFWASWCAPCRAEHPELKKLAAEFAQKGFLVLEISMDDYKNQWRNAMKQDQISWTNLWNDQSWNNAAARKYAIHQIPQNILVDPQGKIVAKNIGMKQLSNFLASK
ncbi:TlpA family protein disulfide reductase [Rhizosphaericola mali]|uniref:TlpA family protein disulfide reductase n=1 Tax=Rhizosphaericola mali TaxID=2545455 RepID=A0A5P2GA93_9BACT|nr:TlpA disulfide reductase family protein [Rhizosphaericola mali]QES88471.1 TlpA family protein disulfide reductase [Rhizosphaericola mali]